MGNLFQHFSLFDLACLGVLCGLRGAAGARDGAGAGVGYHPGQGDLRQCDALALRDRPQALHGLLDTGKHVGLKEAVTGAVVTLLEAVLRAELGVDAQEAAE